MTGYAATAAEYLNAAAEDAKADDLPVRQVAALQGIGYALLALGEQMADGTDAAADTNALLGEIAGAVSDLYRDTLGERFRLVLARLKRGGAR